METIQTTLGLVYLGAVDCIYGSFALKRLWLKKNKVNKDQSKTSRSRSSKSNTQSKTSFEVFVQCIIFGFLTWLSTYMFQVVVMNTYHNFLTPLLHPEELESISWVRIFMMGLFLVLWQTPMFFVSRVLSFVWYQDIADMTCEDVGIKRRVTQSKSQDFSEQTMSALVQILFMGQGYLIYLIPVPVWIQKILFTQHLALLYALYAFEYKWCQKGWNMNRRLSYIECKWPYFVGFGLPLAIVTTCVESYVESFCVFTVLFPVTLIASTVTFNERLQSFNKPVRFFGVATPAGDFIVCCVSSILWKYLPMGKASL